MLFIRENTIGAIIQGSMAHTHQLYQQWSRTYTLLNTAQTVGSDCGYNPGWRRSHRPPPPPSPKWFNTDLNILLSREGVKTKRSRLVHPRIANGDTIQPIRMLLITIHQLRRVFRMEP